LQRCINGFVTVKFCYKIKWHWWENH
jgi:hypothetical protein